MQNFRTDLAVERRDLYKKANKIDEELDGIESEEENVTDKIRVTRVKITNKKGEEAIGKKQGNYITIDIKNMNIITDDEINKTSEVLSNEIRKLVNNKINNKDEVLVVGLGNKEVTPDALGPNVVQDIEITRHIIKYLPQYIDKNTRPISGIAPGVLGTTGIETVEIIKGVVDNIKPKLLVVIDALASRSIERISSSIQLSDTGIIPGGGVENTREAVTEESVGIPVIAIGIPTVVETAVVVNDALGLFIDRLDIENKSNKYLDQLKEEDNYDLIKEALIPNNYNFIVTPKEIDELILNMSKVVAKGINQSL